MTAPMTPDEARLREAIALLGNLAKSHIVDATPLDAYGRFGATFGDLRMVLEALSAERERGDRASSVMARAHNAIGSGKYDRATVRGWLTDGINDLATQKAEGAET